MKPLQPPPHKTSRGTYAAAMTTLVAQLLLCLMGGGWSRAAAAQSSPLGARAWRDTPVRWLMTPSETRQVKRLQDDLQLSQFMDEFWRRRDPDPSGPGNAFQDEFQLRVRFADQLYAADAARGSLSPRGGAFILLGPPSGLTQGFRTVPRLGSTRWARGADTSGRLLVETWTWRPEDLSPRLRAILETKNWSVPLELTFHLTPPTITLADGEQLLDLAARSYLHQD